MVKYCFVLSLQCPWKTRRFGSNFKMLACRYVNMWAQNGTNSLLYVLMAYTQFGGKTFSGWLEKTKVELA